MNDAALFELATQAALRGLDRAEHLLDRVAAADNAARLMGSRLVSDMFGCAVQVRTVTIFALRATLPLAGRDWSLTPGGSDIPALRAQIGAARAQIADLTTDDFAGVSARTITHTAGEAELTQTAQDYLVQFAIPNLWFHAAMAYAILRHAGLPLGKADFDGLHSYPDGFSFG